MTHWKKTDIKQPWCSFLCAPPQNFLKLFKEPPTSTSWNCLNNFLTSTSRNCLKKLTVINFLEIVHEDCLWDSGKESHYHQPPKTVYRISPSSTSWTKASSWVPDGDITWAVSLPLAPLKFTTNAAGLPTYTKTSTTTVHSVAVVGMPTYTQTPPTVHCCWRHATYTQTPTTVHCCCCCRHANLHTNTHSSLLL